MAKKDDTSLCDQVVNRHKWLEDNWLGKAREIQAIYLGDKYEETPFNILYSNTEILVPAIFSRTPTPVVKRRHDEARANLPAKAAERFLSYCMDTNLADYPAFQDAIESSVLDAALPGMGQVRVRLVEQIPVLDYVPFDSFVWGYARRWEDVPWIAYKHDLTRADIVERFGVSEADAAAFPEASADQSDKGQKDSTYPVYEVWDKKTRKVRFVCEAFPSKTLQEDDDPLGLLGFFPSPRPLLFVVATVDTLPRPLYNLYRKQAEELNSVSMRIKRVTQAIRVRGIYNGNLSELSQMFSDGGLENALIPAERPSIMTQDGGLDKQIWMIPNDKLIVVLQQLFMIREQIKSTIYEILGVGDILRGVSRASETLGAQEIKDKWGSLRINKMRDKTASFIRSGMRLMAEVGAKHSPEEIWLAATGMQLPTAIQVQVLQDSGQPPPPVSWPQVLDTLRSDLSRSYIIDIEANSTVDSEATQDKKDVAEFMNALGQALSGLGPMVAMGPEGFQAAKAIILEFIKKFRMGPEVQQILEKLQPPQQGVPPQVQKQLDQAKQQLEQKGQELKQREDQVENQTRTLEQQMLKLQKTLSDIAMAQKELDLDRREAQLEIDSTIGSKALDLEKKALVVSQQAKEASSLVEKASTEGAAVSEKEAAVSKALEGQSRITEALQQGIAQLVNLVQQSTEATETVLEAVNKRPKARFVQNEDGSVIKEYIQ